MATTAISSSTSTASNTTLANSTQTTAAANKAAAQKIITSLSAGSGVDVSSLAQNLVDAERIPRENAINEKISKNEARISGYSAISFMMSELKTALSALQKKDSFNVTTNTVSHPNVLSVTTTASAELGSHTIQVSSLARPEIMMTQGSFGAGSDALNPVDWGDLKINGQTVTVNTMTPDGVVKAINDNTALGVTAKLVKVGSGANAYKIAVTGKLGEDLALTDNPAGDASSLFSTTQSHSQASFAVDGIAYTRNTNSISDVLSGVTLNLRGTSAEVASLDVARDTSSIKDKLNAIVTAYNDANDLLKEVANPKSTLDTYGATLVSDSTARMVKQQLRSMMTAASSTPGDKVSALWQMGISVDENGKMALDATRLDTALTQNFDDVVKALTGNRNVTGGTGATPSGVFGDAVTKINKLVATDGPLLAQSTNADKQNTQYRADLEKLKTRMDGLLQRYTKQFSVMDSFVGQINSQKTSLKSSFEGMMAAYTNKN